MHHGAPHEEGGEDNEVTRRTGTKKRGRRVAQPLIKQEEEEISRVILGWAHGDTKACRC
jgi:hypothetical protein